MGGLISAPPLRFFADNAKTAARSAAALGIAVHSSTHCLKFWPGHVRSALQVTLMTSPQNANCNFDTLPQSLLWIKQQKSIWSSALSQWAKFTSAFSHQNISIHWEFWRRSSVMTQATVFIGDQRSWGQGVAKIARAWAWSHCVSLIKTHR